MTRGQAWSPDVVQRISTLVPLMVFTLLGNGVTLLGNVVIIAVLTCGRQHNVSSRVNIFIINLAIGDLTVLTCTMTHRRTRSRSTSHLCTPVRSHT